MREAAGVVKGQVKTKPKTGGTGPIGNGATGGAWSARNVWPG